MADNLVLFYAMTALVILLIGLSKGGLGGALGSASHAADGPGHARGPGDRPAAARADDHGHLRRGLPLAALGKPAAVAAGAASLIGIAAGTFFITSVSEHGLRRGLGVIVLLFALYKSGVEPA